MDALETAKEVLVSTLPIAAILFVLRLILVPFDLEETAMFLLCVLMVLVGFTMFLIGVEKGINPVGEAIGSEIPKRRSRLFMVAVVFTISFLVTVAEPDVAVFATQVTELFTSMNKDTMVYGIAAGVALFLIIAACRIVFKFSLRILITIGYVIVLVLLFMTPAEYVGISVDSGGVTTGPMTVPILLSLGIGICSVGKFRNELDGYGMIGLASIGPIIALLVIGVASGDPVFGSSSGGEVAHATENIWVAMGHELCHEVYNVAIAIVPLTIFFAFFQRTFLRFTWNAVKRMLLGLTLAAAGVVIFLTGIYTGFIPLATKLGTELAHMPIVLILLGAVLGFLVAIAEPAVAILASRVEESSGKNVSKKTITMVVSSGVALFVAIGMAKVCFNFDILYIVVPGYILAVVLMWLGDKDMVGITFDAGGVATGPMSVAIISTMYTGVSATLYTGSEAVINGFGVISLIALAPLVFLGFFSVYIRLLKEGRI